MESDRNISKGREKNLKINLKMMNAKSLYEVSQWAIYEYITKQALHDIPRHKSTVYTLHT